jgi:hypothetical protein
MSASDVPRDAPHGTGCGRHGTARTVAACLFVAALAGTTVESRITLQRKISMLEGRTTYICYEYVTRGGG